MKRGPGTIWFTGPTVTPTVMCRRSRFRQRYRLSALIMWPTVFRVQGCLEQKRWLMLRGLCRIIRMWRSVWQRMMRKICHRGKRSLKWIRRYSIPSARPTGRMRYWQWRINRSWYCSAQNAAFTARPCTLCWKKPWRKNMTGHTKSVMWMWMPTRIWWTPTMWEVSRS